MKYSPDDPRLTAYVLGELDDSERAEVEALLRESPQARKEVEEVRSTVERVSEELKAEPVPAFSAEERERITARTEQGATKVEELPQRPKRRVFSLSWRGWAVAASVLLMVGAGSGYFINQEYQKRHADDLRYLNLQAHGPGRLNKLTRAPETVLHEPSTRSVPRDSLGPNGVRDWDARSFNNDGNDYFVDKPLAANVPTNLEDLAPSDSDDIDSTRVMVDGFPGIHNKPNGNQGQINGAQQQFTFAHNLGTGVEYDGKDGTTSYGDVVRVGEGPVPSAMSKYSTFQFSTPSLSAGAGNNVDVFGRSDPGWARVSINGQDYTYEWKSEDPTAPIQYWSANPSDPFDGIDNDGDGLIDEITDANGNTFAVHAVPKPEQLGGTEAYDRIYENPFVRVVDNPLSTFSIDVDTASYANVRRFINEGRLPPPDAVRIEELVNYFSYDYAPPMGEHPFAVHVEVAGCPWNLNHRLVRIGLKGREIERESRPPSNLVFLLDVSGSMSSADKLPLVQQSMRKLVERLTANDRVAIVVYAGASGLVLPSTSCDDKAAILDALERLKAGGSTHGSEGIQLAYDTATQNFIEGGVNRVILCTDGDFNVGITDRGQLVRLIEEKAKTGVFLSVLGFGTGNLKDSQMEQLADKGNGNYAYVDSLREGEKVLVEEMSGTLVTIAKDVKIQIEFNPGQVSSYRLIGYENRMLKKEDFNDDTKDAGEIGAGHTVTALYELVPSDGFEDIDIPDVDPLKYQKRPGLTKAAGSLEILNLKLRYKEPDGDTSKLIEQPVTDSFAEYSQATDDFKFAASVAAFGMILRGSQHDGNATLEMVEELAGEGKGADAKGYRAEFIELVGKAKGLKG